MATKTDNTPRRSIVIEDELWEATKSAAAAEHVSAGQWIRQLIRKALGK